MNQDSIDDLLKQVETQTTSAVAAAGSEGGAAAAPAGDTGENIGGGADQNTGGEVMIPPELKRLMAIEVPVIVQLGCRRLTVGEVMRLAVGAIIEFNKSAEEDLELLANNKPIGLGHAVKVGENFGIKISHIGTLKETIRKLGGQD